MADHNSHVCICAFISCMDWRQTEAHAQHGVAGVVGRRVYKLINDGAHILKPSEQDKNPPIGSALRDMGYPDHDLVNMGHRDCGAVKVAYGTIGKSPREMSPTGRMLHASYEEALDAVMSECADFDPIRQRRVLEEVWVLQSANNFLARGTGGHVTAYVSDCPIDPRQNFNQVNFDLILFDPEIMSYVRPRLTAAHEPNEGIRLKDILDYGAEALRGNFSIAEPVDLREAARQSRENCLAGSYPTLELEEIQSRLASTKRAPRLRVAGLG